MIFLLLSIFCSVFVGGLLKIARNNKNLIFFQMITWNYFFAGGLSYWFYRPQFSFSEPHIPWFLFIGLMLLLPFIFFIQAKSVAYTGIVRTDIAQRLSLIISLSAAFFIFKEVFSVLKWIGLCIGVLSIVLLLYKEKKETVSGQWKYPFFVMLGFGIIDVLFKQVALFKQFPYTTSIFLIFSGAFFISLIILLVLFFIKGQKLTIQNVYWGAGLGVLNFGNILFYLKAHQELHDNPSTVFACMNLGVIISGSLLGILFFNEKMSKRNYAGLLLALLAILIITLAQIQA